MTAAIEPVAKLTRRVEDLELARITYRKHTVLAVYPLTSTYDADVEGVGRVNGFSAPAHFLPKVGDVFNLPLKGSVPGFEPNRIAPGAIGDEELAGYVKENIAVAMDAANGKNKVTFAPNGPTSETPGTTAGDVWFQRDIFNLGIIVASFEWTGSAWAPRYFGDSVLNSLTVGKLVGGTGTFDLIVGGRIATANAGQRVEMNPLGFQGFNAGNALTINLDGVNNLITGRYLTAQTGRRIELGASGQSGAITFTSDTGTVAQVQAFTSSLPNPGTEALSMRVPIANTYGAWNSLQIQSNEQAYLLTGTLNINYGGGTSGAFVVSHATDKGSANTAPTLNPRFRIDEATGTTIYDDGNRLRLQITNAGGFVVWDGDDTGNTGDKRIQVDNEFTILFNPGGPNSAYLGQGQLEVRREQTVIRGNTNSSGDSSYVNVINSGGQVGSSARMGFINRGGFGGMLKFYYLASDTAGQRMEVRNGLDTVWIPIWASAFVQSSDRSQKTAIRDLDFSGMDVVRALKPRRYDRPVGGNLPDLEQVGFVTDEMPAELIVGDTASGDPTGFDVMALITALVSSAQNIDGRLAALEKRTAK